MKLTKGRTGKKETAWNCNLEPKSHKRGRNKEKSIEAEFKLQGHVARGFSGRIWGRCHLSPNILSARPGDGRRPRAGRAGSGRSIRPWANPPRPRPPPGHRRGSPGRGRATSAQTQVRVPSPAPAGCRVPSGPVQCSLRAPLTPRGSGPSRFSAPPRAVPMAAGLGTCGRGESIWRRGGGTCGERLLRAAGGWAAGRGHRPDGVLIES